MQKIYSPNQLTLGGFGSGGFFAKGFATAFIAAVLTVVPSHHAQASMKDHQAVMDLVLLESVNRQVVQSGTWSNPATWGGTLPTAGDNIYVPADKTLTTDVFNDSAFGTLRVDGVIKFATTVNVRIKLDTLVVTSTGTFEVGSEYSRVSNSKKVEVIIANNGPIDRVWDPSNISRGVILQGKTRIYGSNKSAYHELAVDPVAGTTQIQLANTPTGWVKGDIIAITATKFRKKKSTDTSYQTEDELRRILAISGTTITLGSVDDTSRSAALQYSHVPTIANMPVYVANMSRNVVFSSEGGNNIPVAERGHFMVMHNPDTIIKGAGFYFMGRTDKSYALNDFKLDANGFRITDAQGNYIPDTATNPRGRYAVHFHHTGVADPAAQPVICTGNAVMFSKGWGFVNHTSNVIMQNNASYDVLGSHYVTEDGNELGVFRHNIAIKSSGRVDTGNTSGIKTGIGNHDHGHSAHGFWFQNRNILVDDNVVSGTYGFAVAFYTRNVVKGLALSIPKANLLTQDKSIVKDLATISYEDVPITHMKNLTVVASNGAIAVIKNNNKQGHDARNFLESVRGYSLPKGISLEYLSKYNLDKMELIADPSTSGWEYGINVSRNDRDIVITNSKVDGFVHPFLTGTVFNGLPDQTDVDFGNVQVNGRPLRLESDIHKYAYTPESNYDPAFHKVIGSNVVLARATSSTSEQALTFIPSQASYNVPSPLVNGLIVKGTKVDSLGEKAFESRWYDSSLFALLKKGYYSRPDGSKFIILTETVYDRITGQTITINTKTNIVYSYQLFGPHLGMIAD